MQLKPIVAFVTAFLLSGCDKPTGNSMRPGHHVPPNHHVLSKGHHAPQDSGVLALDVYTDGKNLHLLTAETREKGTVLMYTRSEDGGETWSAGVRVDEGLPSAHSPRHGMDPQLAASGNNLIAAWMSSGTDKWGGGPLATALSNDGGRTWGAGPNPADDRSTDGHGFLDIAAQGGRFHLTWLDDRNGRRGLRHSSSTDGGRSWTANATVDEETCECCENSIIPNAAGEVAILYRDKGPRDMRVGVSKDAGTSWSTSAPAGAFGWQFDGCPHAGGALLFGPGASLYATVWTGQADRAGLYFVSSSDYGASWSSPELIDPAAVHSDLAVGGDGRIAMVWGSARNGGKAIWHKVSADAGKTWSPEKRLNLGTAAATHPRVVVVADGFRAFWAEREGDKATMWKSARLPR